MIYLDNHATTPCDPRVREAMWPWFGECAANAHSIEHAAGRRAAQAVEAARAEVAALIGAQPAEIIFTSGATEANNIAIKGAARLPAAQPGTARRRLITAATEHRCVLASAAALAAEGWEPVVLPVDSHGALSLTALRAALETPTALVSLMAANNETGVLHDLRAAAIEAHAAGARLHSDLAQAAGRIAVDVTALGLDAASLSAHKLYGPQGIGALYLRRHPRMRAAPLLSGGGQERGLRPGTLPVPLIVGFGEACRVARAALEEEAVRIAALRARLLDGMRGIFPECRLNGPLAPRLPGNLNLTLPGIKAQALIAACPGLALSTGSACSAAGTEPSHVLTAMGVSAAEAACSLRLGIGRFTSAADIDAALAMLAGAAAALRGAAPIGAALPAFSAT